MISPSSPVSFGRGALPWALSILGHGGSCDLHQPTIRAPIPSAKGRLTSAKRSISFGRQRPVVWPSAVLVDIQPYSSSRSAPWRLDDRRPSTKNPVLSQGVSSGHRPSVMCSRAHPRMLSIGDCSAISMMGSMISSSSRKGRPPLVEPIFPCTKCIGCRSRPVRTSRTYEGPESAFQLRQDGIVARLEPVQSDNFGQARNNAPFPQEETSFRCLCELAKEMAGRDTIVCPIRPGSAAKPFDCRQRPSSVY